MFDVFVVYPMMFYDVFLCSHYIHVMFYDVFSDVHVIYVRCSMIF
jgi:hypothetical protein